MDFPRRDLRETTASAHIVPVLNPDGLIKWVRVSNTVDSPILERKLDTVRETGAVVLTGVRVSQAFSERGWELLEDTFKKDGPGGMARFADYVSHMAYAKQCKLAGTTAKPFPKELMPSEIESRRTGRSAISKTWEPSSAPRDGAQPKRSRDAA